MSEIMTALGVVATFCAVLVAIQPILRGEKRRKAEARMLRARLIAEFAKIQPTFQAVADDFAIQEVAHRFPEGDDTSGIPAGEKLIQQVNADEFIKILEKAGPLIDRSYVLEQREQDLLAKIADNAARFGAAYGKGREKSPTTGGYLAQQGSYLSGWISQLKAMFRKNGYYLGPEKQGQEGV